jgi:insulysin
MQFRHLLSMTLALGMLFFDTSSLIGRESAGYTVIEDKAEIPIKTTSFADRKIAKIKLDNGLQAILVSDPNTDQSAATLAVEAGSWQDPAEYPGIAHFLEHMLFLGTKQFPKESEYQKYITEHGGSSNAFTTNSYTAYMFSVDNANLPEALDRFSSFFKDPLFSPSGVSRELNAIDQEFAKNFENDDVREIMVLKETENPAHPNHRFTIGNSNTLSAVSQETLKKWYLDHYSANLMHLYVVSKLPMDELIKITVADFKDVKNRDKQPFVPAEGIANPDMAGKIIYIQPVKNIRTLTIAWELPLEFAGMTETHPEKLLCYILGHEGKESLLAQLKMEKLATEIGCSTYQIGGKNLIMFVEVELTDDGLQHVDHVILRCFQTLAMIREKKFPNYLFDEVHTMGTIDYEYQKRADAFDSAMKVAQLLVNEPIETFPEQSYIVTKFNQNDVQALVDFMTPQNARFFVKAPAALTGVKPTNVEKWLQVSYAVKPIESETMEEWTHAQPIPEISMPQLNPFLPKSLNQVVEKATPGEKLPLVPQPKAILDSGNGLVYYAADERYDVPKLYLYFNVKTPAIEMGKAPKAVAADLYVKGVEEALSKFSYPATMAGLNFNIDSRDYGISFLITGYSDNASLLFDEIIKVLKDPSIGEQEFKLYKQNLLRDYQNFNKETPLTRAMELFQNIIYKNYTLRSQKAAAMRKLTYAKFEEAAQGMFKNSYVEGLIYGNITQEQAQQYSDKLIKVLASAPYPKKDQKKPQVIDLPNTEGPFIFESQIQAQGSAALLGIEFPEYSFKNRAAQQIMMQAISEPFFSDLRTKQQTGYIVFSTGQEEERKLFDLFAVQSNTHDPRDLLARFELFIETFVQELGKTYLTKDNFETIKDSLLNELEKPQNNMDDMGALLKTLAFKYNGHFDWMDKRIAGMKDLTYEEFMDVTRLVLGKSNKRRLGVLTKGVMPEERVLEYSRIGDVQQVKKMSTFGEGFMLPQP